MADAEAIIGSAIQSARYNEAVVVNVNNGDGDTTEIVLVACLDHENGGIVWKNANVCSSDVATDTNTNSSNSTADTSYQEDIGIIRHLRTKRWVLPMLNDHRRNQLYNDAIRDACKKVVQRRIGSSDKEYEDSTIRILDIGSGTGLLAMMGARYTLDAIQKQQQQVDDTSCEQSMKVNVTGVEMASAMARLGRMTIKENDLSNHIKIVEQHSTDSTFQIDDSRFFGEDIKDSTKQPKADICTSELLESGLLGEGVLPAMRDAWKRHLKPDAIVIPKRARVYAVLVEGMPMIKNNNNDGTQNSKETTLNAVTAFRTLHVFKKASGGVWMSTTSRSTINEKTEDTSQPDDNEGILLGSTSEADDKSSHGGITIPLHANAMLDENYNNDNDYRGIRPLSDPIMVLHFDFTSLDSLPPSSGRSVSTTIIPTMDGICHGVLFWWELDLGDVDSTYSTEPIGFVEGKKMKSEEGESRWQDHWQQCLFVFGDGHANGNTDGSRRRKLSKGTPVDLVASHDDTSISFSISRTSSEENEMKIKASSSTNESRPSQRRRLNEESIESSTMNRHITPTRALQLNDSSRIQILASSIRHCLAINGKDSPVLDLSDFGLCGMIAAVSGATKVTSLESSSGALPTLAATVAQIGNNLPQAGAEYQIIQALPEHIKVEHIAGGDAAEIVVAEPYYEMLEGWHLQEALNYFYLVCAMKKRGVISPSSLSVPSCAQVLGCVIEFHDFNSAYGKVGDETNDLVAGLRHDSVNYYGDRYHTYDVSLPLWQYRNKRLSKPFCIATIPYEGTTPSIDTSCEAVEFISQGTAHAAVVWIDYKCRSSGDGGSDCFDTISTASSSHRQLIRKLQKPMIVTDSDVQNQTKYHYEASFGNDLTGIEDHSFTFEFHRKE